ncbi:MULTISPECIES: RNA polymerase sigma-70 factor [Proteiniphilum]|jgi:RNA polymerase sigma-70 factor (ECF subfamily)|uniref:RNA polymerase sigma-70 factor n=2 Tax=Dysgonomonadaceae TaxID=2005520 RepID=UPI001EEBD1D3|nr:MULTISPECIES: RNA polymerase sigma-70 factor [Proteiniphilum]ULB33281.1 RNA polymerase sigma-70 factor [Proteiniphilum propionicum]
MKGKDIKYENLFRLVAFKDDEQAFKELFLEFYPALCVFAMRYITQEETARDIVQDIFFRIWKNRKSMDINTSFRNFLITSVRNSCTDYHRKQEVENRYMEKSMLSFSHISPEEVYTLKELEVSIGEALAKLSPNVREAFEMSRFKGMTYIAIADKMEVSTKTVESYISRALKILRIELRDYLPFLLLFI